MSLSSTGQALATVRRWARSFTTKVLDKGTLDALLILPSPFTAAVRNLREAYPRCHMNIFEAPASVQVPLDCNYFTSSTSSRKVQRVLRPGGTYLLVTHGMASQCGEDEAVSFRACGLSFVTWAHGGKGKSIKCFLSLTLL